MPPAARFPGMTSGVTGIQSKRESQEQSGCSVAMLFVLFRLHFVFLNEV